jgi:hypothetical protein
MEKRFVVKNFEVGTYYQGWDFGWASSHLAYIFETLEDAEDFISREDGKFQIETIYII